MTLLRRAMRPFSARPRWRVAALLVASSCVLGAARWWPTEEQTPRRREIRMRGNSFSPRDIRAAVGDTVIWINGDIVRHNAVRPELFDSGELRSGERFTWVPADTGTVRYQCTIHSRMRGVIRVSEPR